MSQEMIQIHLIEANKNGCFWLGRLARLESLGVRAGSERDEAEQKTSFWLHRYGTLADLAAN